MARHRYTVLCVLTDCSRRDYDGPTPLYRHLLAESPRAAMDRVEAEYAEDEDNLCTIVAAIPGWLRGEYVSRGG